MAKNFNKGIDNVFRATVKELDESKEVKEIKELEDADGKNEGLPVQAEERTVTTVMPVKFEEETKKIEEAPNNKKAAKEAMVNYNIKYPKELQKQIKRFCIENDGIDMKDVFTQGAMLFMKQYKR